MCLEPVPPLGTCPHARGRKGQWGTACVCQQQLSTGEQGGGGRSSFFKGFVKQRRFELWFLSCLLSSGRAYWCVWLWWTLWIGVCLASHYMHCFTVSVSCPLFIAFSMLSFSVSCVSCFLPSPQQASYAASSFSSVSYCVQQPKVPFTPEDCGATQGLTMSVSNSFLSRHSSFPVHSVSSLPSLTAHHLGANPLPALSAQCGGCSGGFWTPAVTSQMGEAVCKPHQM